ncbi:hypothetical protein ES708_30135 [subsurface metagenome]|jgi:hypothetical protein
MKKRTKTGQKRHDEAVLRSVKWYEGRGHKVNADLPDYDKPKKIGGYVPDLIAKKDKKEIILEVETRNTNELDKEQQKAFKEYSKRGKGRIFKKKII